MTFGTVKLVDGDKIYLDTPSGTVTVKTTRDTKVQVTKAGKVTDLKAGSTVVVTGPKDGEGTVDAATVSEGSSALGRRPAS
jgi:hypothetical protein